jgi:hypothetical protein
MVVRLRTERGYSDEQVQALMNEAWSQAQMINGDEPNLWVVKDDDGKLH